MDEINISQITQEINSILISESKDIKENINFYEIIKRLLDIFFSMLVLTIALPLIIIFGILIKIESPGPVIYKQRRVGLNGRIFTIYKLRSMYSDAERNGAKWADKNDTRVTRIGRIIRRIKIDELPQLLNIFKGDMSIVGPRPERPEFILEFEKEIPGFKNRVSVKPGLTGWAQVNGGYDITPSEKYILDMYYISKKTILLDIAIVFKTTLVVLTGRGFR